MTSTGIFLVIIALVIAAIAIGLMLTRPPKGEKAAASKEGGRSAVGGGEYADDDDDGCGCPNNDIVAYMVDKKEVVAR